MINLTKLKVYALGILGALAGALFLKKRGDIYRDQRDTARANEKAAETRLTHAAVVQREQAKARENGAEAVREAVQKARTGDRSHFEGQ